MSEARREASEVLHTLMPIERIEMRKCSPNVPQQIDECQVDVESRDDVKIEESQEVLYRNAITPLSLNGICNFRFLVCF